MQTTKFTPMTNSEKVAELRRKQGKARREDVGPQDMTPEEADSMQRELASMRFIRKHGISRLSLAKYNPTTREYEL